MPDKPQNAEWVQLCELAMKECPAEFADTFSQIMFAGNRMITEARLNAQIDAAKERTLKLQG